MKTPSIIGFVIIGLINIKKYSQIYFKYWKFIINTFLIYVFSGKFAIG